ncbi:MAG: coiled-coil domain-containing protein [Bacillaceae bacterium]
MKKKKRKNLTIKWSNYYIAVALFFILGFGFFSTSKLYMAENLEINQTPLNTEFDLRANGKFMINDWKYDSKENKMEVILVTNGIKNYRSELDFIAVARSNMKKQLQTKVMYNDNDIYILHINNVPKDFQQVALRLVKSEISFQDIFNEEKMEVENNEAVISSIYTDQRKVKREEVTEKDMKEYAISITQSMIEVSEKQIINKEKQIKKVETVIKGLNEEIEKLKVENLYKTVDEQVETNNEIYQLEKEIEQYKAEIEKFSQDIKNITSKIDRLTQRKRDLEI